MTKIVPIMENPEKERDEIKENGNLNGKISKLSQLFVLLPVYFLQLCDGMNSGYPAIINPQLREPCSEFQITEDQKSWIVSIDNVATPVVCIISGYLQHKFGPRKILMTSCIPFFLGWLFASFANSVEFLFVSRLFVGIGSGLLSTTIYTVEITSRDMRGTFSMLESVLRCLGCLLTYVLGMHLRWKTLSNIAMVVPLIALIFSGFVPESPVFLLANEEREEAKLALKMAYGKKYNPDQELELIQENLDSLKSKTDQRFIKQIKTVKERRDVWEPFLIILLLTTVQQFSGLSILTGYVVEIFNDVFAKNSSQKYSDVFVNCSLVHSGLEENQGRVSSDAYITAIIIGCVRLIGSVCISELLRSYRRRTMYFTSGISSVLSLTAFSTFVLLKSTYDTDSEWLRWAPAVSACMMVFSVQLGVQSIPYLLSGELYPTDIRAFCKGITRCFASVYLVMGLKLYPTLEASLGIHGTFYLFAGLIFVSLPLIYFFLPETKDLGLENIQEYFTPRKTIFYRTISHRVSITK